MKTSLTALTVLAISFATVLPAHSRAIETTLQNATSDTNMCKVVAKPEFGKLVKANYPLNLTRGLTADVYDTNTGLQHPSWFYVVKSKGKVQSNFIIAYEGSNIPNKQMKRTWEMAFGSCGGLKTQKTIVTDKNQKFQASFVLGNFYLTQPYGTVAPVTDQPSYKNFYFKQK
jgi:hypothetical protein